MHFLSRKAEFLGYKKVRRGFAGSPFWFCDSGSSNISLPSARGSKTLSQQTKVTAFVDKPRKAAAAHRIEKRRKCVEDDQRTSVNGFVRRGEASDGGVSYEDELGSL